MHVQREIDRLLAQRAAEWIEILKAGERRDHAAFVEWLRQSKLHVEHYLEMVALERELQRLDPAQGEDVAELLKRIAPNVIELERLEAPVPAQTRARRRFLGIGAALAAGVVLCASAYLWRFDALQSHPAYSTAIGEQRTLTLADGSVVALNVASAIRVKFSSHARSVELESGEAVFKVAHNASRPFVVRTRIASVRAVGTEFNVDERPDGLVVSVLEGRVQITSLPQGSRAASQQGPTQNLNAGEEAQVRSNGRINKLAHPDVARSVAWRQRRLIFDDTPLEDIVREFNRYNSSVQIRIEGIAAGAHRYGGVFEADDPSSLADLLAKEPDLSVERQDGGIVIRQQ